MAITIPADMEQAFQSVADETGQPLPELIREALARFLDDLEERQDVVEARQILEEYRRNPGTFTPLDDVLREAGFTRDELQ